SRAHRIDPPLDASRNLLQNARLSSPWGHSSAGRAPAWHAGGRRFDPAWLHHFAEDFRVPSPSSRGLGHYPFTVATGVRIPVGTPLENAVQESPARAGLFLFPGVDDDRRMQR